MSQNVEIYTARLVCSEYHCGWTGSKEQALHAPDPFNEGAILTACPECREQTLVRCCDKPGCNQEASSGTPTPLGYRWTCHNHKPIRTP